MGFLDFGIIDVLDILLVAALLYYTYKLMKSSGSMNLFIGILVLVVIWYVVTKLEMRLLGTIIGQLANVAAVALVILFQAEIRQFLLTLGSHRNVRRFVNFFTGSHKKGPDHESVLPIVMACMNMSKQKVGALIVMKRSYPLDDIIDTGEEIDALVNQRLIENIFFKNSPLHDGAMVIDNKIIRAAGCILPVSHDRNIPKELGLRHRAAMGISQETDALAVVVSEETGAISVAYKGQFYLKLSAEELENMLVNKD